MEKKNNPEEAAKGMEDLYLTSGSNEERLVGEKWLPAMRDEGETISLGVPRFRQGKK